VLARLLFVVARLLALNLSPIILAWQVLPGGEERYDDDGL
jgi:hypothetical protein